jgi:AcrR family transcriptional regulator
MKVQDPVVFNLRKETLMQHARHLFATKGYAETTMDDIAHAAKMQKASLYHYFESKEELLRDMIHRERDRWFTYLSGESQGGSLRDMLYTIGMAFVRGMDDPGRREFFKILHFESHKNPFIFKVWKESPMQSREGFQAMFYKQLEGRLPRKKIAMMITQFIGGLIHYVTLAKLRSENMCSENFDDTSYVQQLVDIFSRGIEQEPGIGNQPFV